MPKMQFILCLAYIALATLALTGIYWAAAVLAVLVIVGNTITLLAASIK